MKWIVVEVFNQYEQDIEVFDDEQKAREYFDGYKSRSWAAVKKIYLTQLIEEWDASYGDTP